MGEQPFNRYGLSVQRPHLVLLGAGASRAAFPKGEKNGRILPLMNDFFDIVDGLSDYLKKQGIKFQGQNFEDVYSSLYENCKYDEVQNSIEAIIYDYFAGMELPDEPTLYDHLVLSLTGRDAIATFNWDPFLWQAIGRNFSRVRGRKNTPKPLFLHGNTAIGICTGHRPIKVGYRYANCSICGNSLGKCKLLYPVKQKDYVDPFIKSSWDIIEAYLGDAFLFTIFGYSAPSSDIKAVRLLKQAWNNSQRNIQEIEVIDVLKEQDLTQKWDGFISSYSGFHPQNNFYSSLIYKNGRRSVQARFDEAIDLIEREEHPIPKNATWEELDEWVRPYLAAEEKVS